MAADGGAVDKYEGEKVQLAHARASLGAEMTRLVLQERELLRLELEASLAEQRGLQARLELTVGARTAGEGPCAEEGEVAVDALLRGPLVGVGEGVGGGGGEGGRGGKSLVAFDRHGLDLSRGRVRSASLLPLVSHLGGMELVTSVDLSRSDLDDSCSAALSVLLTQRPSLRALVLRDNPRMGFGVAACLGDALKRNKTLRFLDTSGTLFLPPEWKGLVEGFGGDLGGEKVEGEGEEVAMARDVLQAANSARGAVLEAAFAHPTLHHLGLTLNDTDLNPDPHAVTFIALHGPPSSTSSSSAAKKKKKKVTKTPTKATKSSKSSKSASSASSSKSKALASKSTPPPPAAAMMCRTDPARDQGGSWHLARLLHRYSCTNAETKAHLESQAASSSSSSPSPSFSPAPSFFKALSPSPLRSVSLRGSNLSSLGLRAVLCGLGDVIGEEAARTVIGVAIAGEEEGGKVGKKTSKGKKGVKGRKAGRSKSPKRKSKGKGKKKVKKDVGAEGEGDVGVKVPEEVVEEVSTKARVVRPLHLLRLDLSSTFCGPQGVEHFVRAALLGRLQWTECVDLSYCNLVSPRSASLLGKVLPRLITAPSNLKALKLRGNRWGARGVVGLLTGISHAAHEGKSKPTLSPTSSSTSTPPPPSPPSLRLLDVSGCGGGDAGDVALLEAMKSVESLVVGVGDGLDGSAEAFVALVHAPPLTHNPPLYIDFPTASRLALTDTCPLVASQITTITSARSDKVCGRPSSTPTSPAPAPAPSPTPAPAPAPSERRAHFEGMEGKVGEEGEEESGMRRWEGVCWGGEGGGGHGVVVRGVRLSWARLDRDVEADVGNVWVGGSEDGVRWGLGKLGVCGPCFSAFPRLSPPHTTLTTPLTSPPTSSPLLLQFALTFSTIPTQSQTPTIDTPTSTPHLLHLPPPAVVAARVRMMWAVVRARDGVVVAGGVHGSEGGGASSARGGLALGLQKGSGSGEDGKGGGVEGDVDHTMPSVKPFKLGHAERGKQTVVTRHALVWQPAWHIVPIPQKAVAPGETLHLHLLAVAADGVGTGHGEEDGGLDGEELAKNWPTSYTTVAHIIAPKFLKQTTTSTPTILSDDKFVTTVDFDL